MKILFALSLTLIISSIIFGLCWLKIKLQIDRINLNNKQKKEYFEILKSKNYVNHLIYNILIMGILSILMFIVIAFNAIEFISIFFIIFVFIIGFLSTIIQYFNYLQISNYKKRLYF